MKKIKCKVCNTRFFPQKEAMYLSAEKTAPLSALVSSPPRMFECFDCPRCGCQTAVNIRMAPVDLPPSKEDAADGQ